jgi:Flp pilus assembly protein TadG
VVPLLLAALLGTIECGWAVYTDHFVTAAANRAVRYAMVRGAACASFASACPASEGDIQAYVLSLAPPGIDPSALTTTATWSPNNSPGSDVTVTVQYNFDWDLPFVNLGPLTLARTAQIVISQ